MTEQPVAVIDQPTQMQTATPASLLAIAVQRGADMATLERLITLQERVEANEARKAYVAAMSAFKSNPPTITKNKRVHFTSTKGTTDYMHATLDNVSDAIGSAMAKHGLSHRWNVEQLDGGQIRVTCVIEHALGHSESVSLSAGPDQTGNKNNIQAVGSTVTYLQRYTLLSAAGMATGEDDTDGNGGEPLPLITKEQLSNLTDQIVELTPDEESTKRYTAKICETMKCESLDKLPAEKYDAVLAILNGRRKRIEESKTKEQAQ